jgi:hypothetical protein
VTTDASGEAIVRLPSYFEALNREFRYQLTVLGQFAQAIIASKIHENQFTIKTDKPGVEVSWQVTGVRKDPYAEQHRIVPEEPKTGAHRGKYLHPDLYGQPETSRVGYRAQVETALPALNMRHPDANLADPLAPSVTTTIRRPMTFQKP